MCACTAESEIYSTLPLFRWRRLYCQILIEKHRTTNRTGEDNKTLDLHERFHVFVCTWILFAGKCQKWLFCSTFNQLTILFFFCLHVNLVCRKMPEMTILLNLRVCDWLRQYLNWLIVSWHSPCRFHVASYSKFQVCVLSVVNVVFILKVRGRPLNDVA